MQDVLHKKHVFTLAALQYVGLLGGSLLYALGMNLFIVPAGLYTGGIMGAAQLLRTLLVYCTGWTPPFDIAALMNYAVNLPLLLLAWRRLELRAALRTLFVLTAMTFFLLLVPQHDVLVGDQLTRCLIGGVLCGGGIGLILWMGGTSGGTDILALLLLKHGSQTSLGHVCLIWNLVLYGICAAVFDLPAAIYSMLFSFVSTTATDKLHMQNINVEVTVISRVLSREMEREILVDLHRGITRYEGVGEFTGQNQHIFYILVSKFELSRLRSIVRRYDPNAFIVARDGATIYGNYRRKL